MICINDPDAWDALAHKLDIPYAPARDWCIAKRDKQGELVCVAALMNYTGPAGSVMAHVASFKDGWLDRVFIFAFFDMAFNYLRVGKIIGIVPEDNHKALRLDRHLGLRDECKIEGVFTSEGNPVAAVVLSMTRDQCRFLEPPRRLRHGQG